MKAINNQTRLVNVITNTMEYDVFPNLPNLLNRTPDETHIKRLSASFINFGTAGAVVRVLKTKAITGKSECYMVDGQHSVISAKRAELPLTVIIIELVQDTMLNVTKYVAALNNSSKAWSTKNFLESFAANEIMEYKVFKTVIDREGLKLTDLLYIFLGGGGAVENKLYKSGEMKFLDIKDSEELLAAVVKVKAVIPNKAFVRRGLYKMLRQAKDYNRMAKAILKSARHLKTANLKFSENEAEFYNQLTQIYKSEFKIG